MSNPEKTPEKVTKHSLIDLSIEQLQNLKSLVNDESDTWCAMIDTAIRTLNLAKQQENS